MFFTTNIRNKNPIALNSVLVTSVTLSFLPIGYSEEYQQFCFCTIRLFCQHLNCEGVKSAESKLASPLSAKEFPLSPRPCLWLQELQPLMAQVSSTHDKTAEKGTEANPEKPPSIMQRSRSCLLKAVSYFAGDMQPFAKWMQSRT